ncbi:MAG: RecQ family ATP-dependent DNA helicase, partial [Sphingobacteriales bacterium]
MNSIVFFDLEINPDNRQICDVGAIRSDGSTFHENSIPRLLDFMRNEDFICGHNVFKHDLQYIQQTTGNVSFGLQNSIDTLFLSPLLFPSYPYHRLLKVDKLAKDEQNNPLNDAKKAMDLFYDEIAAFGSLAESIKTIYYNLLNGQKEFACFFSYLNYADPLSAQELESLIWTSFENKICQGANLSKFIASNPVALAYCLSLINVSDRYSITPPWVLHTFPDVDRLMFLLRNNPCVTGCSYCDEALDPVKALVRYFGHPSFRSYDGKPLQDQAVRAAVNNKSLLAVFPTGGGKSVCFQVPA